MLFKKLNVVKEVNSESEALLLTEQGFIRMDIDNDDNTDDSVDNINDDVDTDTEHLEDEADKKGKGGKNGGAKKNS